MVLKGMERRWRGFKIALALLMIQSRDEVSIPAHLLASCVLLECLLMFRCAPVARPTVFRLAVVFSEEKEVDTEPLVIVGFRT
jgi:hypothetical protein